MPDAEDGFTLDTCELAQCAQINFNNLEQLNPTLKTHPMWHLAMQQFNAVVHRLESGTV